MNRFLWIVVTALTFSLCASGQAKPDASKKIMPTGQMQAVSMERTPEQMDAFAATVVAPESKIAPFRPTIDQNTYRQMKMMAAMSPSAVRPASSSPLPMAPPVTGSKFAGPTQCSGSGTCWYPPDVAGSIGKTQFVSTNNNVFAVYSKSGGLLKMTSLNALFGYSTQPFFDPRVQWDEDWGRWVVTAAAFPESATTQVYGIAVSKTASATGAFWVYLVNATVLTGSNGFYDFPMLGLQQDAVLFTANIFTATGFGGSSVFSVAKALLYNGRGWGVPFWTGLAATLQPARQVATDQNGYAWLAAAPSGSGIIYMYALSFPANPPDEYPYGPYAVSGVGAYSVPAGAPQPTCGGGTNALDTSDNRFVNTGTQNGDLYYQAHSVAFGPAAGRYYVISGLNGFAPAVKESGTFWTTGSSSDFNVSVAADSSNRMVLNWTAVDSATSLYPAVQYTGKLSTDPAISGSGSTKNLFTSPTCLSGNYDSNFGLQRWGDYSQASADPSTAKTFWIENEIVPSTSYWGTEIGKIHF